MFDEKKRGPYLRGTLTWYEDCHMHSWLQLWEHEKKTVLHQVEWNTQINFGQQFRRIDRAIDFVM